MTMKLSRRRAACLVLALLGAIGIAELSQADVRIVGSDTMVNLNRELAGEYKRTHPGVRVDVNGGGSEAGLRALMAGQTDIAAASRAMTARERAAFEREHGGRAPREIVVALDGLGIYVHNNNPVSSLTVDQVAKIMSGEIRNWRDVGGRGRPISVFTRNRDSGTRTYMENNVLRQRDFVRSAHEVATTGLLVTSVARTQGGIGYGGIGYIQGAHVIRLKRDADADPVWPTYENVMSGAYPLSRPLYFYVNPDVATEELEQFLDWVRSSAGQRVVTFVGYYPAPGADAPQSTESGPIQLTPDNMDAHGFDLTVSMRQRRTKEGVPQSVVTIRFKPTGQAIDRMSKIMMHVADDVEAPVQLDDGYMLKFVIRTAKLDDTVIRLSENGQGPGAPVYELKPRVFVASG